MKLITEVYEEIKCLTEETSGKKNFFIEGVFLQSERPNRNKRQYKFETLQREVNRYNEEYVKPNRAYGELGHPDTPSINLERVSHMIKELRTDGTDFYGKAKILDTPYGNIVKSFIEEGAKLGVSSRGMGSLERTNSGISLVKDDFYLATAADIVADPSAPDAFVRGIMENREWMLVEGRFMEIDIEKTKEIINNTPSRRLQETAVAEFTKFLDKLSR
jgi:hypothetical protein